MQTRPFAQTLQEIDKGKLAVELTDQLAKLVAGVMEVGKPGRLTLTLTVRPAAKRADMVVLDHDVTLKEPKPDRPGSVFFASDDGDLSRSNPMEPELPFRRVGEENQ